MSRLRQVLSVGWRFHPAPTPTADPGSSSTDDDEVQELSAAEFKRQSPRLVRRGLEVQTVTKGGMQMKGLFTNYPIQACDFVGFFVGEWYSDAAYEELYITRPLRSYQPPVQQLDIETLERVLLRLSLHLRPQALPALQSMAAGARALLRRSVAANWRADVEEHQAVCDILQHSVRNS